MKKRMRLLACVLATGMIFTGTAVSAESQETEKTTEATTEKDAEAEKDPVMATVEGEEIYQSELVAMTQYILQQYQSNGYDTTDETVQNHIVDTAMNMLVQLRITELKAQELKLDEFTEEELEGLKKQAQEQWDESFEIYKSLYMAQDASLEENDAEEKALETMAQYGYATSDMLFEQMKNDEVFRRLQEYCIADVSVSDEEVKETYEEYVALDQESFADNVPLYEQAIAAYGSNGSYYIPEGYRYFTHIRLDADEEKLGELQELMYSDATAADATAANAQQEKEIQQLKGEILEEVQDTVDEIEKKFKEKESFEDLIKEYSVDASDTNYVGYSVHKDSIFWDKDFVDTAMAVEKIGEISEPVVCADGVYILYYDSDIKGGPIEYTDTLKENLHAELLSQAQNEKFSSMIHEWADEYDIQYIG